MFSSELMRFIINYQKPECNEIPQKHVEKFNFKLGLKSLALILLTIKK